MVTYPIIGTLYLGIIGPSTQCACVNYSSLANMAAEHVVVTLTFGLKVEDPLDSFDEVQTKIKEI